MSETIKVTGIVLSAFPLGENDKRLTILTKERGRLSVMSQGCKRPTSPLFGASREHVYGEFLVAQGRRINYLNSAEIKDTFPFLRESLETIYYSTYFSELAEYFTMEGQDERNILNLLYLTFQTMKKDILSLSLIRRVYELKILQYSGEGLQSFCCVCCGSKENLSYLSFSEGGIVCRECCKKGNVHEISSTVIYALQYVSASPLQKLYSFTLTDGVLDEFCWVVNRFFKTQTEHRFKSEQMLDIL